MSGKYIFIFVLISFVAIQESNGQNLTYNYLFNQSFPNLYNQVLLVMKNVQTLVVNSTLANAQKDLEIAKNLIISMKNTIVSLGASSSSSSDNSNSSSNSSSGSIGKLVSNIANKIISAIMSIVTKIIKQATRKGVNVDDCTNGSVSKIESMGIDTAARVAACPVDQATKAITIINNDIAYVSDITNLTMYAPQALNNCFSAGNISTQAYCVNSYMQIAASKLLTAPATITGMVNEAYAYVSLFPTNVAVCATNTTFTSINNAVSLALNITTCIAIKFLSS